MYINHKTKLIKSILFVSPKRKGEKWVTKNDAKEIENRGKMGKLRRNMRVIHNRKSNDIMGNDRNI